MFKAALATINFIGKIIRLSDSVENRLWFVILIIEVRLCKILECQNCFIIKRANIVEVSSGLNCVKSGEIPVFRGAYKFDHFYFNSWSTFRGGSRNSGWGGFFFKGMGSGCRLKAPSGSRATSWWGPRGRNPRKLLNFVDFRSKINHIVSPNRWSYTLS